MGKLDPDDFPKNVRGLINKTKPELLVTISSLMNANKNLCNTIQIDTSTLPESVWGLTSKTKQELLEIIARKDDVELSNQETIKINEKAYNNLYDVNKILIDKHTNLKADYEKMNRDYNNAKLLLIVETIIFIIGIILIFIYG